MNLEIAHSKAKEDNASQERVNVFHEIRTRKNELILWLKNPQEYWKKKTENILSGPTKEKIKFARHWHLGEDLRYKIEALNKLVEDSNPLVREALAGNFLMSAPEMEDAREKFTKDRDYRVRKALASSSVMIGTQFGQIQQKLLHDPHEEVRLAVASHYAVPLVLRDELSLLYLDEKSESVKKVIEKRVLAKASVFVPPLKVARLLYYQGSRKGRIEATRKILMAMSYPHEAKRLFFDRDEEVRVAVAKSGLVKLFPEQAKQFAHDPNKEVRSAYFANINAED